MAHPYKGQADSSRKSKAGSMGKENNMVIPVMRAVGENSSKKIAMSSNSMQHKDQSTADGYKRGGHVGKNRSKPKMPKIMVVPEVTANPPSPDPSMAAAGAGSSPVPAPMPPKMPGMMARGGRAYPKHGGAESAMGRLDMAHMQKKK